MTKILTLILTFLVCTGFTAQPKPESMIYDPNNYISSEVKTELKDMNSNLEEKTGVYIVDTLNMTENGSIEEISEQINREWKVNYLFVISIKERRLRLLTYDTGRKMVSDNVASNIVDSIKQEFQSEDYSKGLSKMLNTVKQRYEEKDLIRIPFLIYIVVLIIMYLQYKLVTIKEKNPTAADDRVTALKNAARKSKRTQTSRRDDYTTTYLMSSDSSSSSSDSVSCDTGGASGGW